MHFENVDDGHWNEVGHRLVADVLADYSAPRCGQKTARSAGRQTRADNLHRAAF